jgi:hypothetical protein
MLLLGKLSGRGAGGIWGFRKNKLREEDYLSKKRQSSLFFNQSTLGLGKSNF